jgi:hypothetical protein
MTATALEIDHSQAKNWLDNPITQKFLSAMSILKEFHEQQILIADFREESYGRTSAYHRGVVDGLKYSVLMQADDLVSSPKEEKINVE